MQMHRLHRSGHAPEPLGLFKLRYEAYIRFQNLGDLDFSLLRSLKVKCDGVIGIPMYGFLLIFRFSDDIWPK